MGILVILILCGSQASRAQDAAFQPFKAHNNISIEYAVFLPEGYEDGRTYPAILAFPDHDMGRADAEAMMARFWSTPAERGPWIIVVPLVPGEDWRTHPNHHALNDLLDHVNEHYAIQDDKFHILGYGLKGADIASTWASMSHQYFESLSTVSGAPRRRWDASDWRAQTRQGKSIPIFVVVGSEDEAVRAPVETAEGLLAQFGHTYAIRIVPGSDSSLGTLEPGALSELLARQLLTP